MSAPFDAEALVALGRLTEHALSPDGTWVAACLRTLDADAAAYIGTLWRVPLDGTPPTPLTEGPFDDRQPGFKSDGTLCFTSNRRALDEVEPDPKARRQVWALVAGTLTRVTDEPLGIQSFQWARRADVLVVQTPVLPGVDHAELAATAKDLEKGPSVLHYDRLPVRYWDAWLPRTVAHLVAFVGGERRDLTPDREDRHTEWEWDLSEDGTVVVHVERVDGSVPGLRSERPVRVDVTTGEARPLHHDPSVSLVHPRLSPDGSTVVVTRLPTVPGEPFLGTLALIPLADPGAVRLLAEDWESSPRPLGWTRDGGSVLVDHPERGRGTVVAVDAGSGERHVLCGEGTVHGVSIGEEGLVVRRSTYLTPPRLEWVPLDGGGRRELGRLDGLEDLSEYVQVEEIEVIAQDGVPVQCFILTPRGEGNGRTLLWIHGGPISAWTDGWHWRWSAALAACAGYVVVCPNPRGSTGFGWDFIRGIWGNVWGGACASDLMAVVERIIQRDDVDQDKLIAMGGSFGGYMTNWLGTRTDRFAALVTHASVWDFRQFHATTDLPPYWAFMLGLDPWTDGEDLERYNPRAHLDAWTTPTLILHGEKDYRVPISEALALFAGLQARGVDSELVVFPDENHWILKPRNIVAWYEAWMGFVGERVSRGT